VGSKTKWRSPAEASSMKPSGMASSRQVSM
jgi:hypothetical protein